MKNKPFHLISIIIKNKMNKPSEDTIINLKNEVEAVTNVMRDNVDKILIRDAKLGDLEDQSENLLISANTFEKRSTQLRKKLWCQDKKTLCVTITVFGILILVIALIIYGSTK